MNTIEAPALYHSNSILSMKQDNEGFYIDPKGTELYMNTQVRFFNGDVHIMLMTRAGYEALRKAANLKEC